MNSRSVGVEEEFLLVEPETGRPKAVAGTVLQAAGPEAGTDLEGELQQQQLETNSRPCQSLDELHRELRRCRAAAAAAAARAGAQVAALGTSPLPVEPQPLRTSRYERMAELFGLTAHEQLTCGCHVHVGISGADEGVAVLDRAGPWLATLLALSANSPDGGAGGAEEARGEQGGAGCGDVPGRVHGRAERRGGGAHGGGRRAAARVDVDGRERAGRRGRHRLPVRIHLVPLLLGKGGRCSPGSGPS